MEIEWSDLALSQLGDIMDYVRDNFGERVALDNIPFTKKNTLDKR